jgi:hypothetical protein
MTPGTYIVRAVLRLQEPDQDHLALLRHGRFLALFQPTAVDPFVRGYAPVWTKA